MRNRAIKTSANSAGHSRKKRSGISLTDRDCRALEEAVTGPQDEEEEERLLV